MLLNNVKKWPQKFFSLRVACEKKVCGVPFGHSFDGLRPYLYVPAGLYGIIYLCTMEKEYKTIRRVDALRQMEVREDQYGKRVLFSIQFYNKHGEVVTMSHAYTTGLRSDMKSNRLRGLQQCDAAGNKIGHVVPVSIDNIRMFNGQKVVL
jgi:hypothetical protein